MLGPGWPLATLYLVPWWERGKPSEKNKTPKNAYYFDILFKSLFHIEFVNCFFKQLRHNFNFCLNFLYMGLRTFGYLQLEISGSLINRVTNWSWAGRGQDRGLFHFSIYTTVNLLKRTRDLSRTLIERWMISRRLRERGISCTSQERERDLSHTLREGGISHTHLEIEGSVAHTLREREGDLSHKLRKRGICHTR
jgi:hypothetical protein